MLVSPLVPVAGQQSNISDSPTRSHLAAWFPEWETGDKITRNGTISPNQEVGKQRSQHNQRRLHAHVDTLRFLNFVRALTAANSALNTAVKSESTTHEHTITRQKKNGQANKRDCADAAPTP